MKDLIIRMIREFDWRDICFLLGFSAIEAGLYVFSFHLAVIFAGAVLMALGLRR